MTIDLMFNSRKEREIQYNARSSVTDFNALMDEYAVLAKTARSQVAGIYDLYYGMGAAERLDIFPAIKQPSPLLIFIHGGYWRALSKEDSCSMAATFTSKGVAVACIEYTLAPEATLAEIVREVRSAVAWLYNNGSQYGIDTNRIYVSGSSAGGHLASMLVSDSWQHLYQVPIDVIKGALILSGLFDLRPLCDIHVNEWLGLTSEQSYKLSPLFKTPRPEHAPQILLSVGAKETLGFKNQTEAYYKACRDKGLNVSLLNDEESNHFNIVNKLADPKSDMFNTVLNMILGSVSEKHG